MLLWQELIDNIHEPAHTQATAQDDLTLLQVYICLLFLSPNFQNQLSVFNPEELARFLGLHSAAKEPDFPGSQALVNAIRKRERALTRSLKGRPSLSFEPLLKSLIELTKPSMVEIKLLTFAILMLKYPKSKEVVRELEINEYSSAVTALSRSIRESTRAIGGALEETSMLCQVRLLESPGQNCDISDLVEAGPLLGQLVVATSGQCHGRNGEGVEKILFKHICPPAPPALHVIGDFGGVPNLQLMLDYLSDALLAKAVGKNILLYGRPGTGKTQLARAIAKKLGAPLYEVPTKDGLSGSMTGRVRLDAAKMAQMFLEDRLGAMLLFDEMEDAFRRADMLAKGWFNNLLEENHAPVIWISNDIRVVDSAFLRRFDFIVEIDGVAGDQPSRNLKQTLSQLPVGSAWLVEVMRKPWMTPALGKNLAEVGRHLPAKQIIRNQERLEAIIRQRLNVMGDQSPPRVLERPKALDFPAFRSEWINTKPRLLNVERMVKEKGSARFCLYGPPGSGKTAYAQELAKRLGRPFILQSGSNLLGMYVGQTEKNIASMFDKAEKTGAVLLLDEADTFLYNRNMAQRSWEVGAVNEFMVRLEQFDGVFMATTNRFDSFDKAVLRRLQLKVEFGYLTTEQLKAVLTACVVDKETVQTMPLSELRHLNFLTPGLIKSVVQNLQLRGFKPRAGKLLSALEVEQRQSSSDIMGNPIGFVR